MPMRFLPLLMLCLLAACTQEPDSIIEIPDVEPLYLEAIGNGDRASLTDTLETVVRDSAAWADLQPTFRLFRPFKPVDFSQTMVVVAAVPVETGGYRVRFEEAERRADTVFVSYVLERPGADCLPAMGGGVAFQAAYVRRAEGPVAFLHRTERYSCDPD